ncbi:hypothetical protein [Abyssisolibacter fermentans]|uniref:hypothetical protein n=1 Tax=Abyssisolibacter fermentans TaxID=1766203 RepID=UPI000834B4B0|nr:hypothetical protein [Abyssisolibacter fermentans]
MINLFINNIKIILVVIMIWIIVNALVNKVRWVIKYKWEHSIITKNMRIVHIFKLVIIYSLLIFLVTLQQSYNFIYLGKEDNHITLAIGIFTLYGIFYVFVQFAISYASQNCSDKFWGRSKTRSLLSKNIEYKFFNSNTFKLMFLISATFPMLNRKLIFSIKLFSSYKDFLVASWNVSIFIMLLLYIMLFIKSLFIMQRFFSIQEDTDYFVKYMIKNDIMKAYEILFYQSYKKRNNYFFESLTDYINRLNSKDKIDMLLNVLSYVCKSFQTNQQNQILKINDGRKIKKRYMEEYKYRIYDLKNMFMDLWGYIENQELEINFKSLLYIYKLQDSILFNQIYIYCLGNQNKIVKELLLVYSNGMTTSYFDRCSYFKIPNIVWNKVINYRELVKLNNFINCRKASKKLIKKYMNSNKLSKEEQRLISGYEEYLYDLLEKCKSFQSQLKKDDLLHLFKSYSFYREEKKIYSIIQDQIYNYIVNQQYTCSNKEYIKSLLTILEYKYKVTFILFRMLYTGDSYSKWKDDVYFFREINNDYYGDEKINSEDNISFICKTISESDIGHRINNNLIIWIIKNLRNNLTVEIIQRCIDDRYMTYAKFLKFKYIFSRDYYFYWNSSNIDVKDLKQKKWTDWKLNFIIEMLRTPKLLKEEFFVSHHYWFCKEVLHSIEPKYFCVIKDFRVFYINPFFSLSEDQFSSLLAEINFLSKGILEFLILKVDDDYYNYLFSNSKLSKSFKSSVTDIVAISNTSVECYLDNLVRIVNECGNNISIVKKERILFKLKKLIY